ncbi:protein containing SirA-like domain protein, partial [gut metagenome]
MYKEVINALGQQCPIPVVMATRALREMREPGVLEVYVDNEAAVQNVTRMASGHQFAAESRQTGEKEYVVSIQVTRVEEGAKPAQPCEEAPAAAAAVPGGDYVVAITDEVMG